MAQLMPLPLAVSCFSKIQIGFTFLVLVYPGSHGRRAVKRARACVIIIIIINNKLNLFTYSLRRTGRWGGASIYLAEGDVSVADLLGQVLAVDAVEAMCRVHAVHATHAADAAQTAAALVCTVTYHPVSESVRAFV